MAETITSYKNRCDVLFSKIIRARDKKCMRCGRSEGVQLQCSHCASRGSLDGRFDELNALTLCASCHRWWHNYPTKSAKWLEGEYPQVYERSLEVKHKIGGMKLWQYKELHTKLKARLKQLNESL